MKYTHIPKLGLYASRIGFGSFRFRKGHLDVLTNAIQSGINVIDTSSHFGSGESELAIGSVLAKGKVPREELIICSKAGFIFSGPKSIVPNHSVHVKENNYHCIHPHFLESELTASLNRLQLETLDIFMINNPERMLHSTGNPISKEQLYEMLATAFEYLDIEVERRRIAGYGIASNSIPVQTAPDHLSLSNIPKNFVALQYPFNLFERHALKDAKLVDFCEKEQIYQMAQRPLNCITSNGVLKLSSLSSGMSDQSDVTQLAMSQFRIVSDLEQGLSDMVDSLEILAKFGVSEIVAENLSRLVENEMATQYYLYQVILLNLKTDLEQLEKYSKDLGTDEQQMVAQWGKEYQIQVRKLVDCVVDIAATRRIQKCQEMNNIIRLFAHDKNIETNALGICLASLPNATILNGMRSQDHLDIVEEVVGLDPLDVDTLEGLFHSPMFQ